LRLFERFGSCFQRHAGMSRRYHRHRGRETQASRREDQLRLP
jgi:hypothetical protein